jgi:predicted transcriptional regulator
MSNYQPNFNDPRTQERLVKSLTFVKKYLKADQAQWLSKNWINKHLGESNRPLGKYLRGMLLTCVRDEYSKDLGRCKEYILNEEGVKFLEKQVDCKNTQTTYSVAEVAKKFQSELDSGIEYSDKSNRLYHWFQNERKVVKKRVLADADLIHNYDIVCCAPTLFLQKSQQMPDPMDLYLEYYNEYLTNRKAIRQRLAYECETDEQTIKRILNGLFQGGQISQYTNNIAYKELDGDIAKIEFLKQDPFVKGLRDDIKTMWTYLKPLMQVRTKRDKRGITRRLPISGKQKACLYRELERGVLESIQMYLTETSNRFYLEHDGWSCLNEISQRELVEYVRGHTGFKIQLEYESLNNFDCKNTQTTYSVAEVV